MAEMGDCADDSQHRLRMDDIKKNNKIYTYTYTYVYIFMYLVVFPHHYVEGLLFSSALECVVRVCGKRCLSPQHHEHGYSCYLFFGGWGGETNTDKNN